MEKIASYVNKGRTIKELIYNAAGEFPQRYAFRFKEDGEIKGRTFTELIENIESFGTGMILRGYDDCRIGIIGENSFPWFFPLVHVRAGRDLYDVFLLSGTAGTLAG